MVTPCPQNLGLKSPTPNKKDACFTFHTRSAVQSALDLVAHDIMLFISTFRACHKMKFFPEHLSNSGPMPPATRKPAISPLSVSVLQYLVLLTQQTFAVRHGFH